MAKIKTKKNLFQDKTILLLGSGSRRRHYIFDVAKKLGLKIVVINNQVNWSKRLADNYIVADIYNHPEIKNIVHQYLAKNKIDGVLTFEEENVELLGKICDEFDFIGNSRKTAKLLRNKYLMRQQLASLQISQPRYSLITDADELKIAIKKLDLPGVIKPVAGSSDYFVIAVKDKDEAAGAFGYVKRSATAKFDPIFHYNQYQFLYESYLDGPEVTVEAVTQNGQTNIIAIADRQTTGDPYFINHIDTLPSKFDDEMKERIERLVLAAHQALGITNSVSHTQLRITDNGPEIVEVDGRLADNYLWDGMKAVWGVDMVEQAFRVALGLPITVYNRSVEPKKYWVCDYLNVKESGVLSTIHGIEEAEKSTGIREVYIDKEVGDTVLKAPLGFDVIGWVAAVGDSHSEAVENAQEAAEKIKTQIIAFDPDSSVGQTARKDKYSVAYVTRKKLLGRARLEKLRHVDVKDIKKLHVGVLCNIYKNKTTKNDPTSVASDLMSVGLGVRRTLQEKGYRVSFFDMNKSPLPVEEMRRSGVDIIFNVCERINDSSLLEPHAAALLDILQIPYTGSNPLTLAFCIDKIKVKKLLAYHHIPTAKFDVIYNLKQEIDQNLRYPLIVKPANTDNSIGITNRSVVTNKKELKRQLEEVIKGAGRPALVEEYIEGDEYDVSIFGNGENLKVLPLSRSIFDKLPKGYWHIYPFESKFGNAPVYKKIITERPAKIPDKLSRLITEISIDTYNLLGAHDYARVELRVDKDNNPYVIELNPNPSIGTDTGSFECAKLVGYDYAEFLELILTSAVLRYKNKPAFSHLMS